MRFVASMGSLQSRGVSVLKHRAWRLIRDGLMALAISRQGGGSAYSLLRILSSMNPSVFNSALKVTNDHGRRCPVERRAHVHSKAPRGKDIGHCWWRSLGEQSLRSTVTAVI